MVCGWMPAEGSVLQRTPNFIRPELTTTDRKSTLDTGSITRGVAIRPVLIVLLLYGVVWKCYQYFGTVTDIEMRFKLTVSK